VFGGDRRGAGGLERATYIKALQGLRLKKERLCVTMQNVFVVKFYLRSTFPARSTDLG
jgi:hypothetical protein